jgi:hypothetical protein
LTLNTRFDAAALLLNNLDGNEQSEQLITQIKRHMLDLVETIRRIRQGLDTSPYPFQHAQGKISIAELALEKMPATQDIGQAMSAAEQMLDHLLGLYLRIIGRLAWIGEQVEAVHGLAPLAEPQDPTAVTDREPIDARD